MGDAKRDANRVPTLIGVSTADGATPILLEVDPGTGELLVKASVPETPPTDATKTNPSLVLSYNAAGECVKIEKTIGATTYTKTFTRSDNVVASTLPISVWS